jgi:hypothetical protein
MYPLYKEADYRQIMTLKRPASYTRADLEHWFLQHAQRMSKLPGLKWYTVLFTVEGSPFGAPPFDAYEDIWFGSLADLQAAYQSATMQRELEELRARKLDEPARFQAAWMRENIVTMKGYDCIPAKDSVRLVGICTKPPKMSRQALKDWFYQHAARVIDREGRMIIPGIRWYTHSFLIDESPYKPHRLDGCAENWWDTLEEMKRDFEGEVMKSQLRDREENIDIVDPSYFQGAWAEEHIIPVPTGGKV